MRDDISPKYEPESEEVVLSTAFPAETVFPTIVDYVHAQATNGLRGIMNQGDMEQRFTSASASSWVLLVETRDLLRPLYLRAVRAFAEELPKDLTDSAVSERFARWETKFFKQLRGERKDYNPTAPFCSKTLLSMLVEGIHEFISTYNEKDRKAALAQWQWQFTLESDNAKEKLEDHYFKVLKKGPSV